MQYNYEGKNPDRSHIAQLARQGDMSQRDADHIFGEVQSTAARWPDHAARAGVSPTNIDRLAISINPAR